MARRTQLQLAATRETLLAAGRAVFAEKGYANAQIAEIARAAGVGISSFYGQFTDKEDLYLIIVDELLGDLRQRVAAVRAGAERQDALALLATTRRIYDIIFSLVAEQPQIMQSLLRSGFNATPVAEQRIWQALEAIIGDLDADLARAEALGALRLDSRRDFSLALLGMVLQLMRRMVREGGPTPAAAALLCTRMTLGGLIVHMPAPDVAMPLLRGLPKALSEP